MSGGDQDARLHVVVEGHVHGVGFRYYVTEKADLLNVTGWVRNTSTGDVEVVAEGSRGVLEDLLNYVQHGPRGAYVTNLKSDWETSTGEFSRFEVRRTE